MPKLRLTGSASCPARSASEYLERFLLEHAVGDLAVLALRPGLTFSALPDLTLVRDCVVDLAPLAGPGPGCLCAAVTWHLAGDDAAVRFDGTLAIIETDDELRCSVLLRGRYRRPPRGGAPALERQLGRRIAEGTGGELLAEVTRYLSASYRSAQTARLNRSSAHG